MGGMKSLQKTLLWVLSVLTVCMVALAACLWRAVDVNPNRLVTTTLQLKSDKIPKDMQDVSIVYFTDLEYGPFENQERAQRVFDRINALNPSVVIYGGDLFEKNYEPSPEDVQQMSQWLSSIPAPLGKFAVWGEQDLASDERLALVSQIYGDAQIEVLDNTNQLLCNRSGAGIRLVGLSPQADYDQALAGLSAAQYTLLVSHYTDPFVSDALSNAAVDQALGGNSHGTQITWPVFGGTREWKGSTEINRASSRKTPFPYYISSGTGCVDVNARLNATPEVVYILLSS